MSDLNRPRENRLKGKFKGLLDHIIGANRSHDERSGGSRLDSITPMPRDSILTRSRSTFTRAPRVIGEGTSLVCLHCVNKFIGSCPFSSGIPECNAGGSQLHYEGFDVLCGSECVSCDNSINDLRY